MSSTDEIETLEVKYTQMPAWMMIIFGCLFACLGTLFMMPFLPRQNVLVGIGILLPSVALVIGGRYWLKHTPVVMRLTPKGLEIPKKGITYLWSDFAHVYVKSTVVNSRNNCVCLLLTPESKARYNIKPDDRVFRLTKAFGGDYDLIFGEQQFSLPAEFLASEINKRLVWNAAKILDATDFKKDISLRE